MKGWEHRRLHLIRYKRSSQVESRRRGSGGVSSFDGNLFRVLLAQATPTFKEHPPSQARRQSERSSRLTSPSGRGYPRRSCLLEGPSEEIHPKGYILIPEDTSFRATSSSAAAGRRPRADRPPGGAAGLRVAGRRTAPGRRRPAEQRVGPPSPPAARSY